ncbi:HEAT repeat domain-containing protein [uncultured Tateyamaria sp.]|uniref:HEAT repeat domain-containing protein n=1 Tax=uncultured Tateyamaria sp. TaxID=455651 RepID=UPI0026235C76|nr:HEAT repeat domain-containing protein [uncultured Tateyamaria sp.]
MSSNVLSIMQQYANADDPAVRRNLCDALVADGTPEAAELLLDLAMQDDDPQVNACATDQITTLSPAQLQAVQPTLAQRFAPQKGKPHILNWVRSADRVAKGTDTSLFAGFGNWWQEARATRKLNRQLLFSRKNEFGFMARILNRQLLIAMIMAVVLTLFVGWLLIDNPDEDIYIVGPFAAIGCVLFIGVPLATVFAPPTLAFRRSVIAYVDAMSVVKFSVIPIVLVTLFAWIVGEPLDSEFYWPVILYVVVPLFFVRLALNVATRIRQRVAYPLLLCLVTLGVLILVYSCLLWIFDAIEPDWYDYGETMSGFLLFTVPIALFMAIHKGSFGNQVRHTGETKHSLFYNKVLWMSLAGLAVVFMAIVTLAPGSGLSPPGRGEAIPIALRQASPEDLKAKESARTLMRAWEKLVVENLSHLREQLETDGKNRQLVLDVQNIVDEIEDGPSARRLRELADDLLNAVYRPEMPGDLSGVFEERAGEVYLLADRVEAAGPVAISEFFEFKRSDRVVMTADSEGELDLSVTAMRNGRVTELVIWVNGVEIDERPWRDPELFQQEIAKGETILIADMQKRTVDFVDIIAHFQTKIAYVMNTYMPLNMTARSGVAREAADLVFMVELKWAPNAAPLNDDD